MKIVIFAGGTGRRLWPLSRKKSPKQFEAIIGEKSTVQLAVDRVKGAYGLDNIFISTNERYTDMLRDQLPGLPRENVIGEPTRRDLAAAVGLSMIHLSQATEGDLDEEPVAILWGDNLMENVPVFQDVLTSAESLLTDDEAKIVFMGETPRFPNENLGWIELGEKLGEKDGRPYYRFGSLTYRPEQEECERMFEEETHVWNTGYFVTTLGYVRGLYREHQPAMWEKLAQIEETIGTDAYEETLNELYPQMDVMSFDDAILEHVPSEAAVVVHGKMGWSDPGTLYALKEAINPDPEANVTEGLVVTEEATDCLVYNYESDKLTAVVGVEGMIVINMDDALLVVHKDHIPLVKQLVNGFEGTELESYS